MREMENGSEILNEHDKQEQRQKGGKKVKNTGRAKLRRSGLLPLLKFWKETQTLHNNRRNRTQHCYNESLEQSKAFLLLLLFP